MTPKRRNRNKVEEEDKKMCERLTSMRTIIGERKPYDRYDVRTLVEKGSFVPVPEAHLSQFGNQD